jgi:ADP-sugar diphosphatase
MASVEFRGHQIPAVAAAPADAAAAVNTDLFKGWLAGLDPSFDLQGITVQSVDRFGSTRIGFIKFRADIRRNGVQIPGVVVLRGSAVAVLLIITDSTTGEQWTILAQQPRVPTGRLLLEIPARMSDGAKNLRGVAIQELAEECGLVAAPDDLIDLIDLAYHGAHPGAYMSGGLVDEFIVLYLWRATMSHERVREIEGRLGGESEHEQIVLRIVKLSDVWKVAPDNKTLCALTLYYNLLREGKL